jgi:four helix bundle protein
VEGVGGIMKTKDYKDLIVYRKAYELALHVYRETEDFPDTERYGLAVQMRRAATSIPSNIAEGYRRGKKEYIQFLKIAHGSCAELETQLSLSKDLGYLEENTFMSLATLQDEVSRLLSTILKRMVEK